MTEAWQSGAAADGRGIILWVPAIANPAQPKVSELTAATAKRVTYGLTPDGFQLVPNTSRITSRRYTAKQELSKEGTKSFQLTLKYVYNRQTPTEVETVLVPGTKGFFVQILGYPNEHTIAAATKVNAVVPVQLTKPDDVEPTANEELFKTMVPDIIGEVQTEVAVVA